MKRYLWKLLGLAAGGAAGFGYYHYIGCSTGSCPITSHPWISSAYGALIGWLAVPRAAAQQKDS